jgi:hypothetical protein
MLQKVAYGGTRNPDHSGLKDLGLREILTLTPLLVFVFWIGLHPEPFTRVMHASMQNLLTQTHQANPTGGYALRVSPHANLRPAEREAGHPSLSEDRLLSMPSVPGQRESVRGNDVIVSAQVR